MIAKIKTLWWQTWSYLGIRRVRRANIPSEHRDLFERYGETAIQLVIAANHMPRADELQAMYSKPAMIEDAAKWLTERADIDANHERRVEMLEWGILVFVILGVLTGH